MTDLTRAIEANDCDKVRQLLDGDAALLSQTHGDGFDNRTPLQRAAELGFLELCRLLLDRGADPSQRDANGGTALWFASERGHTQVVALLKERGAAFDADAEDSGEYENAGLNFD